MDYNALVVDAAGKAEQVLQDALKEQTPRRRTLLKGRCLMLMYMRFFNMGLNFGDEQLREMERAEEKPAQPEAGEGGGRV